MNLFYTNNTGWWGLKNLTIQSGDETSRQSNQGMKPHDNPISGCKPPDNPIGGWNLPTIQSVDETSRKSNQWMKPPENPISGWNIPTIQSGIKTSWQSNQWYGLGCRFQYKFNEISRQVYQNHYKFIPSLPFTYCFLS